MNILCRFHLSYRLRVDLNGTESNKCFREASRSDHNRKYNTSEISMRFEVYICYTDTVDLKID